jgi:hypothetical protein
VRKRIRKKDGGNSGGRDKMNLDPAWVPIISGFIGGAVVWVGGMITDFIKYRREEKRRVREEGQRWLESRKIAYYKFIDVFSTPAVSDNILYYFRAVLEAAEYGDVILSTPLKASPQSIAFEINSLDKLLAALIFMKSTHPYTKDLEDLRSEALTPFLNEFMNKLRQSEYHLADKAKEIKKKGWWQFWK